MNIEDFVKPDLELRRRYEEALAELEKATGLERYRVVGRILETKPRLYLAASIGTERTFFAQVLKESRQSVYRKLRICKHATNADYDTYGLAVLDAAMTYLEGLKPAKKRIDFKKVRIPVGGGVMKPLSEVSVAEVRRATAALRPKPDPSPKVKLLLDLMKRAGLTVQSITSSKTGIVLRIEA